jgi:hypothetical protein
MLPIEAPCLHLVKVGLIHPLRKFKLRCLSRRDERIEQTRPTGQVVRI